MIAGRTTCRSASSRTAPCICPERPIAPMVRGSTRDAVNAERSAACVARHQSSGDCSAQAGRGDANAAWSHVPAPSTRPSLPTTRARVPLVPTSIPTRGTRSLLSQHPYVEPIPLRSRAHLIRNGRKSIATSREPRQDRVENAIDTRRSAAVVSGTGSIDIYGAASSTPHVPPALRR